MCNSVDRNQAVNLVGLKSVQAVESENVDFTNLDTECTAWHGYTQFSASVECKDQDDSDAELIMYCYIDSDELDGVEDLSYLDWETSIKNAEYKVL